MNEFYKGFRKYDLEKSKGELISEIYIPELNPHEGSAYLKLSVRKAMDLAIIGTAAWVHWAVLLSMQSVLRRQKPS